MLYVVLETAQYSSAFVPDDPTRWLYYCIIRSRNCLLFANTWAHAHGVHVFSFLCSVLFVIILCFVYPTLPVSLACPFLITSSVFTNVYLRRFNHFFSKNIACKLILGNDILSHHTQIPYLDIIRSRLPY